MNEFEEFCFAMLGTMRRKLFAGLVLTLLAGLAAALAAFLPDVPYDPPALRPPIKLPRVFAHRSAGAGFPGNTMEAVQAIIEAETGGIELDVQISRDGVLFVYHDRDLDRLSTGTGRLTSKMAVELSLLHRATPDAPTRLRIPKLDEVLARAGAKTFLFLDAKEYRIHDTGMARELAALIGKYGLYDTVIVESFNPFVLKRLRAIDPRVRIMMDIAEDSIPKRLEGSQEYAQVPWILRQEWYRRLLRRLVRPDYLGVQHTMDLEPLKALGYPLVLWTVNDPKDAARFFAEGATAVQTDIPLILKSAAAGQKEIPSSEKAFSK